MICATLHNATRIEVGTYLTLLLIDALLSLKDVCLLTCHHRQAISELLRYISKIHYNVHRDRLDSFRDSAAVKVTKLICHW